MPLFKSRRHNAYAVLITPHLNHLFRTAFRLTGNKHDAEDLVQELVLKLQPRQAEISQLAQPHIWLTKVLYRKFVDEYRRKKRSPIKILGDLDLDNNREDYFDTLVAENGNPEDESINSSEGKRLSAALTHLNKEEKALLLMYEVDGYSLQELQQIFDMPSGTLKSKLFRARRKIREISLQGRFRA